PGHQVHHGFGLTGDSPLENAHVGSRMKSPTTKRCLRRCDRGVSSACPSHGALSFWLNFQRAALHGARERTPRTEVLAPRRNHVVQTNLEASGLNTSRSASPSCSSSLSSVANKSTIRVPFSI